MEKNYDNYCITFVISAKSTQDSSAYDTIMKHYKKDIQKALQ